MVATGAMAISDAQEVVRASARSPRDSNERWLAVAGVLVCMGAVALASTGASGEAAFGRGLLEALIVGVPIAVGLYAAVNATFGIALLAIGFAWSLTESSLSVPSRRFEDGETRTRTGDTTIFSRVLYQLSYLAVAAKG
jgi:hypothetical protein